MAIDLKNIAQQQGSPSKTRQSNGLLDREIRLSPTFAAKDKLAFYRELTLMLNSGLPLKETIELIANEQENKMRKEVLQKVLHKLNKGENLESSLQQSGSFSEYELVTIRIGEETGKLQNVTKDLAAFFENKMKQKRALMTALSYPIVIFMTSIGAVVFMLLFMVPMFEDVFARSGKDLPAITKMVVAMSGFISSSWRVFLLLFLGMAALFFWQRNNPAIQRIKSKIYSRMPIFGSHYTTGVLMQWNGAMALLLQSGVNLMTALELSGKLAKDYQLKTALKMIERDIIKGATLHKAMQAHGIFNKRLVTLIKVAEEAHALNVVFGELSTQYREEIEHRSKLIGSLIEPFIILFLGLVVGFILLAMYLPIFQMGVG